MKVAHLVSNIVIHSLRNQNIHTDVCGPMSIDSVGGSRYCVTFINDYLKHTIVYTIKHESEMLHKFKEYLVTNFIMLKLKRY